MIFQLELKMKRENIDENIWNLQSDYINGGRGNVKTATKERQVLYYKLTKQETFPSLMKFANLMFIGTCIILIVE